MRHWLLGRLAQHEGRAYTPPEFVRVDPLAAVVWALLSPGWVGAWLAPILALPGDRFRSSLLMATVQLLDAPRGGVARCYYWTDEARVRGLGPKVRRVDLRRGGWCRP